MRCLVVALFFMLGFSILLEADVDFIYTWKSPDAQPVTFAGKKVAVILVSKNRAPRRAAEEALAKEITERGAEGIAGNTLVTESELKDKNLAQARFKEQGVAGVVVIRGTPKGGETVDPEMWKDPIYKDIWGFTSRSWTQAESANEPKQVKFRVEIAVYALEQDQLIWMGTTDLKSTELGAFIQEIVDEIADEMLKAGLLIEKQ